MILFAQETPVDHEVFGISIDALQTAGAWGIVAVILGVGTKMLLQYWKGKLPLILQKDKAQIKLQTTLTENSTQQTEILTCMKDTLSAHSETCVHQRTIDAEAQKVACTQLKNIHEDLAKFSKDVFSPDAVYSKKLDRLADAGTIACSAIEAKADTIQDPMLASFIKTECQKIKAALEE